MLGQHYFSELWHNGQRVKFDTVPTVTASNVTDCRRYSPLLCRWRRRNPLPGRRLPFPPSTRTYYVDMFYDKDSDFSLPAGCGPPVKATVMTPKPNDKMLSYAQSLDKADAPPEDMALGSYFAQKVTLTCQ